MVGGYGNDWDAWMEEINKKFQETQSVAVTNLREQVGNEMKRLDDRIGEVAESIGKKCEDTFSTRSAQMSEELQQTFRVEVGALWSEINSLRSTLNAFQGNVGGIFQSSMENTLPPLREELRGMLNAGIGSLRATAETLENKVAGLENQTRIEVEQLKKTEW